MHNEKFNKITHILKKLIFILIRKDIHIIFLGVIFSIVIKLIRPIKSIKLVPWTMNTRIGHFASETDIYISEKKDPC